MVKVIKAEFDGQIVPFNELGWFNATVVAKKFGKRPSDFFDLPSTKEYMAILNTRFSGNLTEAKRGKSGGTWVHPKLGVLFARWCDIRFAIWCDEQIEANELQQRSQRKSNDTSYKHLQLRPHSRYRARH